MLRGSFGSGGGLSAQRVMSGGAGPNAAGAPETSAATSFVCSMDENVLLAALPRSELDAHALPGALP